MSGSVQRDHEVASLSALAKRDVTPVRPCERANDGQTEPGPAGALGRREESVEDLLSVGLRDAGPVVDDVDRHRLVSWLHTNCDGDPVTAVRATVLDQIDQDRLDVTC